MLERISWRTGGFWGMRGFFSTGEVSKNAIGAFGGSDGELGILGHEKLLEHW